MVSRGDALNQLRLWPTLCIKNQLDVLDERCVHTAMQASFVIVNSQLELVAQLEAVQCACFPTLAEDEIMVGSEAIRVA